jgi:hypothetical protein
LAASGCLFAAGNPEKWTAEWDRALLKNAVDEQDREFDQAESMLARPVGAEYHYHTNIRSTRAHPTRDSLDYSLNLLETGDPERRKRALAVLERLLALQDTDPGSKWYGLWGYYMEEPASKMSPADWNWADFNGATLLMLNARHGEQLSSTLHTKVLAAIQHCAVSVMRRNVAMTYTNIATQGTFVTLAAAALAKDVELERYATERMRRLLKTIDETGSFAEYNSPTYANVTIVNLTRMRMLLRDAEMLRFADRIHERIWLHLAKHWHAPTGQLAGPMSRCYTTDIGKPLWMQKALGGAVAFATLSEVRSGSVRAAGEVSYLEYRCPESLRKNFTTLAGTDEHRELFMFSGNKDFSVEGATYLTPAFCLGSANRSEFWIQRRPLLAYWGGSSRPAHFMQMRFLKDDYDFSSALFFAVQSRSAAACLVNFRSPGGDKHISLDPIEHGEFEASRLRVRFDLAQVSRHAAVLVNGKDGELEKTYPLDARVAIDLGGALLGLQFRAVQFGSNKPLLTIAWEDGLLSVSLDLLDRGSRRLVKWSDVQQAFAVATLQMSESQRSLSDFDRNFSRQQCKVDAANGKVEIDWTAGGARLQLAGGTTVASVEEHNRLASFALNGKPVPEVRLSDEKLLS